MVRTIDLGGTWQLQKVGERTSIAAQVPGDVYNALLAAKKIPDPYYRDNENELQWIGESDWLFRRTFQVPAALLNAERVLLRCEGLDTFATVRINGKKIAATDNMFRTWEFDVRKRCSRPATTRSRSRFDSVMPYIVQASRRSATCTAGARTYTAGPSAGSARSSATSAGTGARGWSPAASGGTSSWSAFDAARLTDVQILQDHARGRRSSLTVKAAAEVVGDAGPDGRA